MKRVATVGGDSAPVEIREVDGGYHVVVGETPCSVETRRLAPDLATLWIDGTVWRAEVTREDDDWVVIIDGERHVVTLEEEARFRAHGSAAPARGGQTLRSPMPGKITHVAVSPGSTVQPGDALVVIEAMKMENEMKATVAGTVTEVRVAAGQPVNAGDVLVVIG